MIDVAVAQGGNYMFNMSNINVMHLYIIATKMGKNSSVALLGVSQMP